MRAAVTQRRQDGRPGLARDGLTEQRRVARIHAYAEMRPVLLRGTNRKQAQINTGVPQRGPLLPGRRIPEARAMSEAVCHFFPVFPPLRLGQ